MIQLGSSKAIFAEEDRNKKDFADPNIVRVELHRLSENKQTNKQQPSQCVQCKSFYTNEEIKENKWKCQFCETINDCQHSEQQQEEELEYFIEKKEIQLNTESTIVFCIDISGSMQGHPLNCVKNAIIEQIKQLKSSNSHQKICIVQFESTVDILGDCCHSKININNRFLNDYESLVDIAKDKVELFDIQQSADNMIETVRKMNARASTALGPAVLVSTVIAGKETNGQVILCTDGMANSGLSGSQFYNKVADYALEHGVIININTVDGCNANVNEIRDMAMKTGGNVTVLKVEDVGESFSDMMSNKLVAKQAQMSIHLPTTIKFDDLDNDICHKNQDKRNSDRSLSHITVYKGNILDDSDFYFRFALRNKSDQIKSFPLQVVVEYTNLNGEKWRRIVNKTIEVASVGENCEKNGEIIQAYYIRRVGESKRTGNIQQTQANIQTFRNAQTLYHHAQQQDYGEVIDEYEYGMTYEDTDDYYSSKTAYTTNFSNKRMYQEKKFKKQDFKKQTPHSHGVGGPIHPIPSHSHHHHHHPGTVPHHPHHHPVPAPIHHIPSHHSIPEPIVPVPGIVPITSPTSSPKTSPITGPVHPIPSHSHHHHHPGTVPHHPHHHPVPAPIHHIPSHHPIPGPIVPVPGIVPITSPTSSPKISPITGPVHPVPAPIHHIPFHHPMPGEDHSIPTPIHTMPEMVPITSPTSSPKISPITGPVHPVPGPIPHIPFHHPMPGEVPSIPTPIHPMPEIVPITSPKTSPRNKPIISEDQKLMNSINFSQINPTQPPILKADLSKLQPLKPLPEYKPKEISSTSPKNEEEKQATNEPKKEEPVHLTIKPMVPLVEQPINEPEKETPVHLTIKPMVPLVKQPINEPKKEEPIIQEVSQPVTPNMNSFGNPIQHQPQGQQFNFPQITPINPFQYPLVKPINPFAVSQPNQQMTPNMNSFGNPLPKK